MHKDSALLQWQSFFRMTESVRKSRKRENFQCSFLTKMILNQEKKTNTRYVKFIKFS